MREKGNGYLFKRNGTYYIRYNINGKQIVKTLKTTNKQEAEAKAKELSKIVECKTKEEIAVQVQKARKILEEQKKTPINRSWDIYLKNKNRPDSGEATLKSYRTSWNLFLNSLSESIQYLEQLSPKEALSYMETLSGRVSNRTYNIRLQACKLICKTLLDRNPFEKIKSKNRQSISKKDFTEDEIEQIFKVFDNIEIMHKDEMLTLFMLGRWTGLRLKDCALLKWEDVDLKNKLFKITTKKTKIHVIIPIQEILLKRLIECYKNKVNEYVLEKVSNRYNYNPSGIVKDCTYILQRAGIKTTTKPPEGIKRAVNVCEYGFHSFRHSFVSFCAKAGVPMAVVQAIVGHSSPAMTRHYTHIGVDTLRQAIEKL